MESGKGDGGGSAVTTKSGCCFFQMHRWYFATAGVCSQETDGGNKALSWVDAVFPLGCLSVSRHTPS